MENGLIYGPIKSSRRRIFKDTIIWITGSTRSLSGKLQQQEKYDADAEPAYIRQKLLAEVV